MIPWSLLFPAVAIVVWRELRAERTGPCPLGLTLPLAWLGTMFVGFGLLPHKRPDLIYAAEPAVALLAARLLSDACPWRWPRRAWPWMTAAGIGLMIVECVQDHRSATRYAYSAFGRSAREEASSRGARLVHTGFRSSAPLFHLRIAGSPSTVEEIAGTGGPILVVAPDRFQAALEAELGPLEIVDTAEGRPGTSEPPRLHLFAPAR
jgi:hypothetical protein